MDLNDFIKQSIQEVLNEGQSGQNPTPAPAPSAPQPITVNIQGQPVTFRDQADLEAQLNATAAALRAQQTPEPAPAPAPTGSRVTGDDDSGFDNAEYIRLMNEDPRKATNYALSHVLFDGKIEDPAAVIRESLVQQSRLNQQLAVYQFRDAHREIPLEDPRVGGTISQIREQLGLPYTSQGLDAAYAYAVQKNLLPDFRAIAAQQQGQPQGSGQPAPQQPQYGVPQAPQAPQNSWQQPAAAQNPYLAAPPAGGRSATFSTPISIDDVENLSTDQLASLLRKLESAGVPTGPAV